MQKFKNQLVTDLNKTFNTNLSESSILDLDSSTEEKFSRHLIFDLIFMNNFHVGNYVRSFCSKFEQDKGVQVKLTDKNVGIFVDQGVYTKNRNFRLYLSSKFGKSAILREFSTNNKTEKDIFLDSLLTYCPNISAGTKCVTFGADTSSHALPSVSAPSVSSPKIWSKTSPFPEIDQFVVDLISQDSGYIRKWLLAGSPISTLVNSLG
jgi:hypothetical protein